MRLIDVDVLKSHIKAVIKKQNGGDADLVPIGELLTFIGREPTAYDVDSVVEQLEKVEEHCLDMHDWQGQSAIEKATAIVKGGGQQVCNSDDITKAVRGLDIFTKNWCMNCEETERQHDLIFRCKECEFRENSGACKVKEFVNRHNHDYPMEHFGSMSH